jgi:hypothetical protein
MADPVLAFAPAKAIRVGFGEQVNTFRHLH